jgi:hypothetical protein
MQEMKWDDHTPTARRSSARWAASARGWLFVGTGEGRRALGNYLDYGPDHYRSPHEYCGEVCRCAVSQPGSVHAVSSVTSRSRYCETVEQAKAWIESEATLP